MARIEPVDCPAILGSEDIDAADGTTPLIPYELKPYFTFGNIVPVTDHKLRTNIVLGVSAPKEWTKDFINKIIHRVRDGTMVGTYGVKSTTMIRDDIGTLPIHGKSVLVIGTEMPWVEAILLHFGASKVTTLEYSEIVSYHPQIVALRPHEFRAKFLAGTLESFDGVVTHSSLEHSGLGRYGDALNPCGNILAVARVWCVTKEGGFLYLGLPTGEDAIMSNWHRTYGRTRWPLVAANWKPMPSTSDGSELTRGIYEAFANGGFGMKFTKADIGPPLE